MRSAAVNPASSAGGARAGWDGTGDHGARRASGDGARGGRDHAGRGGGVPAPGPGRRYRRAGRPGSGADARRGAGCASGTDAVPGGDRDQGVHQPGRPRPRAGPAPPADRGRRGISGLPPGGVRDRAVPRARAGRHDGPSPVPEAGTVLRSAGDRGRGHLRLPRVHLGVPSRDLGVQVLARLRPWLASLLAITVELTDRERPRHGLGELAVPGLVTLADGTGARAVAGRRRLRYGGPPPHRAGRGGR